VGDVVQGIIMKRQEDIADAVCFAFDEFDVVVDLLFDDTGCMILEYPRL
jgi:hypothetical protein